MRLARCAAVPCSSTASGALVGGHTYACMRAQTQACVKPVNLCERAKLGPLLRSLSGIRKRNHDASMTFFSLRAMAFWLCSATDMRPRLGFGQQMVPPAPMSAREGPRLLEGPELDPGTDVGPKPTPVSGRAPLAPDFTPLLSDPMVDLGQNLSWR